MKPKIKLNLNLNSQVHCKFDLKSEILIYLYLKKEHIFKKNQKKKKKITGQPQKNCLLPVRGWLKFIIPHTWGAVKYFREF